MLLYELHVEGLSHPSPAARRSPTPRDDKSKPASAFRLCILPRPTTRWRRDRFPACTADRFQSDVPREVYTVCDLYSVPSDLLFMRRQRAFLLLAPDNVRSMRSDATWRHDCVPWQRSAHAGTRCRFIAHSMPGFTLHAAFCSFSAIPRSDVWQANRQIKRFYRDASSVSRSSVIMHAAIGRARMF